MMRAVWLYLKFRAAAFGAVALFAATCALVFGLYALPAEAVLYAALLCAAIGAVFIGYDAWRFWRRHVALADQLSRVNIDLGALPPPATQIERDYAQLLASLEGDRQRLALASDRDRREMIDYYTLWVHQIKTPISAMKLVLDGEPSGQSAELLAQLFKIEQYVEMVLVYLRMGSETTDYVIKTHELDAIVRQALRKYAPLFIRAKLRLDLRPMDNRVLTDEKWLCFAIEQLLSNAIKYAPSGGISVFAKGDALVIRDTGIGIAPEDLPRVFERGYTGYNGRSDKRASGIGLYLCKQILERLGHKIAIESEVGVGTSAIIDLSGNERAHE